MTTHSCCSQSAIGFAPEQRTVPERRGRRALSLVAAWLGVIVIVTLVGSVVPAHASGPPKPTVTSVTPSSGPTAGGTSVTIGGTTFKKVQMVKFGSTNATSFAVNSAKSITAVSPPEVPGKVDVTVTTAKGTSPISATDTFEFTPTVTGVSPNTGPPAGGTPVTITGSGFAVGKSATGFRFGFREEGEEYGAVEAVGVSCTTTTECTATTPELSELLYENLIATVDVTAIVNNVASPQTPEDQFNYHGLYLVGRSGRFRVGAEFGLIYTVGGRETRFCSERGVGGVASNGETTDVLDVFPAQFSCNGALSFALHLSEEGSAAIEGPLEVRNDFGCVYEGDQMTGSFELNAPLNARLGETFALVREEVPGSECAATEHVELEVESDQASTELFG
jgi:IPT/TIG domain